MRQGGRVLQGGQIEVDMGLAEERPHPAQDADGGIQRIDQRFLHVLPGARGDVAAGGGAPGVEVLDASFQFVRDPLPRTAGAVVQQVGIVRKEALERFLLESGGRDAQARIQRRAEIVVAPAHVEPDQEPHDDASGPSEPAEDALLFADGSHEHEQERDDESDDHQLFQRKGDPGDRPGKDGRNPRITTLRVEIRHCRAEAARRHESQQQQADDISEMLSHELSVNQVC